MREIHLHNFVAGLAARVTYVHRQPDFSGRTAAVFRASVRILECREAQTVSKRIKWFAIEIAVRTLAHRVVIKRRKLIDGLVESHWQPSRRTEVARKQPCDRRSALLARIPRVHNRR